MAFLPPHVYRVIKSTAPACTKRKPVCLVPWKKRQTFKSARKSRAKSPGHNSGAQDSTQARAATCSGLSHSRTKSHPAMFYSYYLAKGYEYRKICAPKKRACDGYFGCDDFNRFDSSEAGM